MEAKVFNTTRETLKKPDRGMGAGRSGAEENKNALSDTDPVWSGGKKEIRPDGRQAILPVSEAPMKPRPRRTETGD